MARRGDGIYLRGRTWWLAFMHQGQRHYARLGKGINRTAAGELAAVKRAAILKGEAVGTGPASTPAAPSAGVARPGTSRVPGAPSGTV